MMTTTRLTRGAPRRNPVARILIASVVCGATFPAFARALDPSKAITQYQRDAWQVEEGLPQNTVSAILQTREGYLWLGTQEGLARFDGIRFERFNKRNTPAIASDFVRTLAAGRDGVLWVGTFSGLIRSAGGSFTTFTPREGLAGDRVLAVAEGPDGILWVGTNGGLNRLVNGVWSTLRTEGSRARVGVLALCVARDGRLWIGLESGLARLEGDRIVPVALPNAMEPRRISSIWQDAGGRLWVGTDTGLVRIDGARAAVFTEKQGLPDDRILAIVEDRDRNLWVGTEGGLVRVRGETVETYGVREGLTDGRVLALFEDREGSLWIGTGNGGLNRLKDGKVTPLSAIEGLPNDSVRTILEDSQGAVWVGTDGGLGKLSGGRIERLTTKDGLSADKITALFSDSRGALWIGTYGGGLDRLERGKVKVFKKKDGLAHDVVTSIAEDSEGRLWIGTGGGLSTYDGSSFTSFTTRDGLPSNVVIFVHPARDGALWIGTYGGGLVERRAGRFRIHDKRNGDLPSDLVVSVLEDREGTLWVGTLGGGLVRIAGGKTTTYGIEDGLYDDNVFQILEDDFENLWMSCNRGIFRVAKRDLAARGRGEARPVTSVAFGKSDGMRSAECTGGSHPAGWKMRDGRLWFPTIRGIASIAPARIATNRIPPEPIVEGLVIGGRTIRSESEITLPSGSRNLEIVYTAASLRDPTRVTFSYRLEPFESDWVAAGARREAYYTNLPPGLYQFHLVASNEDGLAGPSRAALRFRIRPAFWQSLWFRGLGLFAIGLLILGAHRARTYRMRRRTRELERMVGERTDDLRRYARALEEHGRILEQVNVRVREADRAKSRFLANLSHEIRTPLNSIIGFSEILIEKLDGKIDERFARFHRIIVESGQHLLALINDVLDLAKVESGKMELHPEPTNLAVLLEGIRSLMLGYANRRGVAIDLRLAPGLDTVVVDPPKVKQILFNLASNAVKFSPEEGSIEIAARSIAAGESPLAVDSFEIVVVDQGAGIAPEQLTAIFEEFRQIGDARETAGGTGLGLPLARRFAEIQGGSLVVESTPGEGSRFRLLLPVDVRSHLATIEHPIVPEDDARFDASEIGPPTVLVVEGDREWFKQLALVLEGEGLLLVRASSGDEARAMAKELKPALVVLDLVLPQGDGLEVLKGLKTSSATSNLPVLVVSVSSNRELSLSLGAADHFTKPIEEQRFVARIKELLATAICTPLPRLH